MDGKINGWKDEWMDRWMDGWTDRWMEKLTYLNFNSYLIKQRIKESLL